MHQTGKLNFVPGLWPFIALGVLDRVVLIVLFGQRFVSTDDAVIWHAAVDYSTGVFHGPYYYGQNYAPMLEALLAAPLYRSGIPINILMPAITSLLTLLPYWSFAFWFQRQHRTAAALLMVMLPLLMPVEYGAMTTLSRGFVTGAALLALLPWVADAGGMFIRSVGIGAICSLAWFVNPNTLVMTPAFVVHFVASHERKGIRALLVLIGALVGLCAYLAAQHWCLAHPDRIVHQLVGSELKLDPVRVMTSLLNLDEHFQWLMPVLWPFGALLAVWLLALIPASLMQRDRALALALVAGSAVIMVSFTMDKVHDGWDSVFYPLSRMYLCLPLLVGWATAMLLAKARVTTRPAVLLVALCFGATVHRACTTEHITERQVNAQRLWVGVWPVQDLVQDARRIQQLCEKYDVGLIVPMQLATPIWPQFRAYLHPVLDPTLPPTYLVGYERRYWVRETFADSVVPCILIAGGDHRLWKPILDMDARYIAVPDDSNGAVHILQGNTLPTDSLLRSLKQKLTPRDERDE